MKRIPYLLLLFAFICSPVLAEWQMKEGPLMTRWASEIDVNAPFPEYPRPQMVRQKWQNLNGIWQFQAGSASDSTPVGQDLSEEILVPFPMESAISGIMAHHERSWYRRSFTVPADWSGNDILLHLDAIDWESEIFINGTSVSVHKGGYDPITLNITSYLNVSGPQELIVRVYDPTDNGGYPRGKQTLYPGGIMYTAVSGIWQSVWMEPVALNGISNLKMVPDIDSSVLNLNVNTLISGSQTVDVVVRSEGQQIASISGSANSDLIIDIPNQRLWSPDDPFLYDLEVTLNNNGSTIDHVESYFGMRKVELGRENGILKTFLNNEFVFEMGPLDQGWWPDGLYTAPTEEALKYDIIKTKEFGYNMTRKHIKVEPARWYYWADKIGLMVWQDMPSVNSYTGSPQPIDAPQFELELNRMIETHWNSPSIISWVVFNEWQGQHDTAYLVNMVKAKDPSRLVNQGSGGGYDNVGDIYDIHSYPAPGFPNPDEPMSSTMARVCGEYGGIGYVIDGHLWNPDRATGIYSSTNNALEHVTRYSQYCTSLLSYKIDKGLSGAVYTEITDVENECNGLMTYDRIVKVSEKAIAKANYMVIHGDAISEVVLPTSSESTRQWRHTETTPDSEWYTTTFDDTAWPSSNGGFGTDGTPNATIGTEWNTSDIWMRTEFTLGDYTPAQIETMIFNLFHDEDYEIYINGVLASSGTGYTTNYVVTEISAEAKAALVANATNVIAVHCHQTDGGQFIDLGISIYKVIQNAPYKPVDPFNYWSLDETSGVIAADSAGGNDGTVFNSATWSPDGVLDGCVTFDGVDDYIEVNRQISDDFSIAFWANTTQVAPGNDQWWQGNGFVDADLPFSKNDFGISLLGSKVAFGIGNVDKTIISQSSVNDGQWHLCVATRNSSGEIKLYIDGVLEVQDIANANALTDSDVIKIGRSGAIKEDARYYSGKMDDVRIYDRVLGDLEISALYRDVTEISAVPDGLYSILDNGVVTLVWDDAYCASSYVVKKATVSGGPYAVIGTTEKTQFVDDDIDIDVNYYYVISAVNNAGESADSEELNVIDAALKAWFKASELDIADGDKVNIWPDLSGNGYNASQSDVARRPVYSATAMNGHPALHFTQNNNTMLAFSRPVADDFTIMVVFQSTQGIGTGEQYYQGAGLVNGEVPTVVNDFGTCLNANGNIIAGTGNPDRAIASGSGYNDGEPHVFSFTRLRSTGQMELYVDGVFSGSRTGGTNSLLSPQRLVIGAQQVENNYLTGDIAEVRIYSKALASDELAAIEGELIDQYIVGLPLAATAPAPADESGYISAQSTLSWKAGSAATLHKVYMGIAEPLSFVTNTLSPSFDPGILAYNTDYLWRVDEVNSAGATTGDLWTFSTAIAGDFDLDQDVDLVDIASLASVWFNNYCNGANSWCQGGDLDQSGAVDVSDLEEVSNNWLVGVE